MAWEFSILDWIRASITSPAGDAFFAWLSPLFNQGLPWIALALVLLSRPKTRRLGVCVAGALVLELCVVTFGLKPLFDRVRPCALLPDSAVLIPRPVGKSFPSGHTASSFAVVGALWFCRSRLVWPGLVLAALVAFSRLYLYVHFPTDVAAGVLVGLACGWAAVRLYARAEKRTLKKKL